MPYAIAYGVFLYSFGFLHKIVRIKLQKQINISTK